MPHSDDTGSAKRVPHHRLTREQRFADVRDRLTGRLDRLRAAIDREHPIRDCLPLPTLELPANPDGLDRMAKDVDDNLFNEDGNRAQRWIDARAQCSHLAEERVNAVFEMVYTWYRLLGVARDHLEARPLYDLDMAEENFDRWIPASSPDTDVAAQQHPTGKGRVEGVEEADQ